MKLMTDDQRKQMLANGAANARRSAPDGETEDFRPVDKLFCPYPNQTKNHEKPWSRGGDQGH
jgi:hypothetical protein